MRCFRVDEDGIPGIHLSVDSNGNLCVEVGETSFPLGKEMTANLLAVQERIVRELKTCLVNGSFDGEELGYDEIEELVVISERAEKEKPSLMYADLSDDNCEIVRERRKSVDALVLVETAAGPNGTLNYRSNTFEEYVDPRSRRVCRRYRESFPPPGVKVIAEGSSPTTGDKFYLLRMMPASSFRIERTGDLGGCPPVLTVMWRGRKGRSGEPPLSVLPPKKYQLSE